MAISTWRTSTRARRASSSSPTGCGSPQLGIHYKLGLDGLNLFLVLTTTVLFAAALLAANLREWERPRLFYFMFGLAESGVLGAFCAQDLALFVAFFDLMLIPFYFLIGAWGGRDRVRATTKLVIYTLVGSLFMLAGAIATGVIAAQGDAAAELRALGPRGARTSRRARRSGSSSASPPPSW